MCDCNDNNYVDYNNSSNTNENIKDNNDTNNSNDNDNDNNNYNNNYNNNDNIDNSTGCTDTRACTIFTSVPLNANTSERKQH